MNLIQRGSREGAPPFIQNAKNSLDRKKRHTDYRSNTHRKLGRYKFSARWETLQAADLILCEDTRHSAALLAKYGIQAPTTSYGSHNLHSKLPWILDQLRVGKTVALISDAGPPGISDPGSVLVRAAIDEGFNGQCNSRRGGNYSSTGAFRFADGSVCVRGLFTAQERPSNQTEKAGRRTAHHSAL